MQQQITIEVAFALPDRQTLLTISIHHDATLEQAIQHSGILQLHPEIDLSQHKVGIWSKHKKLNDSLRCGDRIEIYRPLIADPKAVRKRRAQRAQTQSRAKKMTEDPTAESRMTGQAYKPSEVNQP